MRSARRLLDALTFAVFVLFTLTALGVQIDLHLFGGHQRVTGFGRPFLVAAALLAVRALVDPNGVRRFLGAWRANEAPRPSDVAAARRSRRLLAATALAVAISPLFEGPFTSWDEGPSLGAGALLLVLVGAVYALFGARRALAHGERLEGEDVVLLLAFPLYVAFVANGEPLSSGDNLATSRLGPLIVQKRTLDLSSVAAFHEEPLPYAAVWVGDRLLPSFPLGTGLLSVPYAAAALVASSDETTTALFDRWEKHFASLLTVGAAVLLFLALRRRFGEKAAFGAALLFGLATPAFSTGSQALWSTTGEVFLICLVLFLVLGGEPPVPSAARLLAAGAALGGAFLCRPSALLAGGFVALAVIVEIRGKAWPLLAAAGLSVGLAAAWLGSLYGHPLGGYGLMNASASMWAPTTAGALGTLFSPSRGLVVFFPYVLLAGAGLAASSRPTKRWWLAAFGATVATYALAASYGKWWGGASLGPRLMSEASPFMALLALPLLTSFRERGRWRWTFLGTALFAAATQVLIVNSPAAIGWSARVDVDRNPESLWSLRDSQIVAAWLPRDTEHKTPAPPPP
ncbi:MAG TPA: hypothetical protein VGR00_05400 [Thermoanaerobaculia bacterium]|nr:hypothetical protein [Thermoanaerobaculia bacterium]